MSKSIQYETLNIKGRARELLESLNELVDEIQYKTDLDISAFSDYLPDLKILEKHLGNVVLKAGKIYDRLTGGK